MRGKFYKEVFPECGAKEMEVHIKFDTEKESVGELRRLIVSLQELIKKKEKAATLGNPMATMTFTTPAKQNAEQLKVQEAVAQVPASGRTAGGGRVVPYEDLSPLMAKIFSGK